MAEYTIENFKENIDTIKKDILTGHEHATLKTDEGNIILISEEDYNNIYDEQILNQETIEAIEQAQKDRENNIEHKGYTNGKDLIAAMDKEIEGRKAH